MTEYYRDTRIRRVLIAIHPERDAKSYKRKMIVLPTLENSLSRHCGEALRPSWTRARRIVTSERPLGNRTTGDTLVIYLFLCVANPNWHKILLSRVLRLPVFVFTLFWFLRLSAIRERNFDNRRLSPRLPLFHDMRRSFIEYLFGFRGIGIRLNTKIAWEFANMRGANIGPFLLRNRRTQTSKNPTMIGPYVLVTNGQKNARYSISGIRHNKIIIKF